MDRSAWTLAAAIVTVLGPAWAGLVASSSAGASEPLGHSAQGPAVVARFDFAAGELPEGVAVDREGNVYVGMAPTGEIKKVTADGAVSTFARLPDPSPGLVLGLSLGFGCVFALAATGNPDTHGVWCIAENGLPGDPPFAPLDPAGIPNAIAFGDGPMPFVSDGALGRIWTFRPEQDATGRFVPVAAVWKEDPLLMGNQDSPLGVPIGASGLAFRDGYLYAANTDYGRIVRIPVLPGVSSEHAPPDLEPAQIQLVSLEAGEVEIFAEDPALLAGADGIAFDSLGNLYVAVFPASSLVRISPRGEISVLAGGEPLQYPASLAFGPESEEESVYVTNFPILHTMGMASGTPMPALLKITVGAVGSDQGSLAPGGEGA